MSIDAPLAAKYAKLTTDEIRTLVGDERWLARLAADVQTDLERVSQVLIGRIRQPAERYAILWAKRAGEVETLAARKATAGEFFGTPRLRRGS